MQIFIEIEEKENRLKLLKEYKPIVCGNTNYAIKFTFDEEWAACNKKTAWFVVEGKNIPIEFEGEICPIPAMPNQNMFFVFLIASKNETECLTTTSIHLILEKNPAVDRLKKIEPFKSYYAKLLGAINNVEAGNVKISYAENSGSSKTSDSARVAQTAEFAENSNHSNSSDTSLKAEEAAHAKSSDEAIHAVAADSATTSEDATHSLASDFSTKAQQAEQADEATHAVSADTSLKSDEATHAASADISSKSDEATHAASADEATHAVSADKSTVAERSNSEVSLTGDQTIGGVKNFTGDIQFNGVSLTKISSGSNPNLLINGDFKINQRLSNTYTKAGDYTVDRWKLTSGTVTVSSNGIILNGTITQTFESEVSAPYTASADSSHGEVSASFNGKVFSLSAKNVSIGWAKLERGTVATPFQPKSKATELRDCHRFYLKYSSDKIMMPFLGISDGTNIYFMAQFPEPMRASPAVRSAETDLYYGGGVMSINFADIFSFDHTGKICIIQVRGVSATAAGGVFYWRIKPGGCILFDAEI